MTKNSAEESRDSNDGINENVEEVRELSMIECLPTELLTLVLFPLPFKSRLTLRQCSRAMALAVSLTDCYLTEPALVVGRNDGEKVTIRLNFGGDFRISGKESDIPVIVDLLARLFQRVYCETVHIADWGNVHSSVEGLVETVLHSCNYHHFNMAVENLDDRTTKLLNGQVGKHVSLKVENTVARDAVHLLIRPVDLVYDGGSSYDSGCRLGNKEVLSLFKEGHSLMHFYVNISVDTVVTILKLIGSATHNQSLNLVVAASIPSDLLLKLNVRKANAIQGGLIMPGGKDYMGCFDSSNDKFEMIFLRYKGIIFQTHDNFSSRTVKITMRKELESDSDYFSYLLSS